MSGKYLMSLAVVLSVFSLLNPSNADAFYNPDDPKQIEQDQKNIKAAIENFPKVTKAKTTQQHLLEELQAQKACRRAFSVLSRYPKFVEIYSDKDNSSELFQATVKSLGLHKHPDIQNLINRSRRINVFFDFHLAPAIASVNGVNCDTSLWIRFRAAEEITLDSSSFKLRAMMLDTFISNLEFPDLGMGQGYAFGQVQRLFDESYSVYRQTKFKSSIDEKVKKAISIFQKELAKGSQKYEQYGQDELARRILDLTKMLES